MHRAPATPDGSLRARGVPGPGASAHSFGSPPAVARQGRAPLHPLAAELHPEE
ncbi:hypothetical protein KPATCC21470_2868 [Kitasatospora purpeofusca]